MDNRHPAYTTLSSLLRTLLSFVSKTLHSDFDRAFARSRSGRHRVALRVTGVTVTAYSRFLGPPTVLTILLITVTFCLLSSERTLDLLVIESTASLSLTRATTSHHV